MVIDHAGYRLNVGIVITNKQGHVFWGRRVGQDTWQFPQGGVGASETLQQAMYRELNEEVGLEPCDVTLLGQTQHWLRYRLPDQFIRRHTKPTVIGQKQKWFLVRLACNEQKIRLNLNESPEFDSWRWVPYDYPVQQVIYFKRDVYRRAMDELAPLLKR